MGRNSGEREREESLIAHCLKEVPIFVACVAGSVSTYPFYSLRTFPQKKKKKH